MRKQETALLKIEMDMKALDAVMMSTRKELLLQQDVAQHEFKKMEKHFLLAEESLETQLKQNKIKLDSYM